MLNDFRKSIQSVLYERVRSPVSGAFFFSWIVWNWKLIYYLIFSNILITTRIQFVEENYINIWINLVFPFLSTIFLITVYPFVTTGGYWVWLKFKTWQTNIKNEIEETYRLSIADSLEIKMQIRNQEIEIEKILRKKDEEILLLKKQLEEYTPPENKEQVSTKKSLKYSHVKEFQEFGRTEYIDFFNILIHTITSRNPLSEEVIPPTTTAYFESNDIIKHDKGLIYSFTEKGKEFVKYYLSQLQSPSDKRAK